MDGKMFELGAQLKSKKNHACGGNIWKVVRVGADYKMQCVTCGRVILIDSETAKKRFVGNVSIK